MQDKSFFPLLVVAAMLTAFQTSCKKEEAMYKLPADGLKYIQLRPGQFFIYKDSASGKTDSVVVTESSLTAESFTYQGFTSNSITARREVFRLVLTRKNGGADSTWLSGTAKGDFGSNRAILKESNNESLFVYPAVCLCYNIYSLASMSVEGKTYNNVMVVEGASRNLNFYDLYWAPSVGLIRMRKHDLSTPLPNRVTTTWNLLRHN